MIRLYLLRSQIKFGKAENNTYAFMFFLTAFTERVPDVPETLPIRTFMKVAISVSGCERMMVGGNSYSSRRQTGP